MLASSPSSHLQPGSPSTFTILGCTRGSLQTVGGVSRASPHVFAHCIFRLGNRTYSLAVLCLVAQSCPTLRPYDHSPPGSSVHGDSLGKNTGVGCHALLQGIFPTQGSNLHLLSPTLAGGFFTTSVTWVSRTNLAISFYWMQKRWKRAGATCLACPGLSAGGARDSAWCSCGPAMQELVWAANGGWGLSTTHPLCFKDKQLRASESQTSGLFQFVGLHCNSGTFLEA